MPAYNHKNINHKKLRLKSQLDHSGIPRENVIDLRKIQKKREQVQFVKPKSTFFARFRNTSFLNSSNKKIGSEAENKNTQEKVVVSKSKPVMPKVEKIVEVPAERLDLGRFQLAQGWYKRVIVFALICLVIALPVYFISFYQKASAAKGTVLGISSTAYEQLQEAGTLATQSEFSLASDSFSLAANSFVTAQEELGEFGSFISNLSKFIPSQAKSAQHLLLAGENISQAGAILTEIVGNFESFEVNPFSNSGTSITQLLDLVNGQFEPVEEKVIVAINNLEQVRIKDIPEEYREGITKAQKSLPILKNTLRNISVHAQVLLEVLGHEKSQRYLFVFQNSRELRPTGGFIGSIALMDIYQGRVENLEVPGGGVYDVAGQLREKIVSPKPLWLVNPHWNIQDSNWFPDFPTSAKKIMWFYERTGGTTVDGIIALTPRVIENLLDITGPIDMQKDYGVKVDSGNFIRQAQIWAEIDYNREENKPKKFIGDLLPLLLNKVFQAEDEKLFKVIDTFNKSLAQQDLILYFSDPEIQGNVNKLGWDAGIKQSDKDYLYLVNTNIAGGKTDHVVDQFIEHEASIQPDGSVINTVTVTRAHRGSPLDRWEGEANVSYLRFYVPWGSKLISAKNFTDMPPFRFQLPDTDAMEDSDLQETELNSLIDEKSNTRITSEFGKTVFGNWISVDPGKVQKAVIQYKLPFKIDVGGLFNKTDTYELFVQKQPGFDNSFFNSTVSFTENFEVIWLSEGVNLSSGNLQYTSDLDNDKYFGVLYK